MTPPATFTIPADESGWQVDRAGFRLWFWAAYLDGRNTTALCRSRREAMRRAHVAWLDLKATA